MAEQRKYNIKRLLIRYIRDHQLMKGMRLPGQTELRAMFGCGVTTLTSAIRELCQDGMVETRDKVGVYVLNAAASGTNSRRIGVIMGCISGSPYYAFLNMYLEEALSRNDCRTIWFHQLEPSHEKLRNGFDDIANLKHSVDAGELDGVISMIYCSASVEKYLSRHGIRIVYLSAFIPSEYNIRIDYCGIIRQSVSCLAAQGLRRIELLATERFDRHKTAFLEAMADCGLSVSERNVHTRGFGNANGEQYISWLHGIFQKWIDTPEDRRPEGLIIPDDMIACRFNFFMQRHAVGWHPRTIILNNINMNLPFEKDNADYWEMDISKFADFAVEQYMGMLQSGGDQIREQLFLPRFVQRNPQ